MTAQAGDIRTVTVHSRRSYRRDDGFSNMGLTTLSATTRPKSSYEIRSLQKIADDYMAQKEESDAIYEVEKFQNKKAGKNQSLKKPNLPMPEGVDLDMLNNFDDRFTKNSPQRPSTSFRPNRNIIQYCPACNPKEEDIEHLHHSTIHIPRGGCHWQLLDSPEEPKRVLPPFNHHFSNRPFIYPARHIGQPGIQVLIDDLVESREYNQTKFENTVTNRRNKEKEEFNETIRNRVDNHHETIQKFHSKTKDLAHRSGQLKAAAKLIKKKRELVKETPIDPEDIDAINQVNKFDEQLWSDYQIKRKHESLSSLITSDSRAQLLQGTALL
ncbi:hypothetical protein TVAG_188060 [Trichomonas vaginalis G3]|uniref:Uncharacterized protein n=1 Tax=Trichomonas vaginalis (strain ATCC PRA-98 / G3) TaxID=412133 RepID=A2DV28_TRIV3|nr:hypothetical protein TVAGG3_0940750 [Trichomonas vaginalis G3]EAY15755.1 hypothetical protein TVAG_188060 [Trichomonas vaginalis G3]KAI5486529.1 hypothetical protein TVAGG3_0940750 [Trichomonas vaginalis G3]|eukprot:XP_001327978.1 hypothetical protein [Trichomonas vaginalis G3]